MMRIHLFRWFLSDEHGSSLIEMAIAAPLLLLLLLGVMDFGRAFYLMNEIAGAAEAGASFGSQDPKNTSGMQTVAKDNAPDVASATDISAFNAFASWGCECSDGTHVSSGCTSTPTSCAYNVVDYVTVTVSATYKCVFAWPGLPSSIPLSQTVSMRSAP